MSSLMSSLVIVITYLNLLKILLMDNMHLFDRSKYHFYQIFFFQNKQFVIDEHKSYDWTSILTVKST